MKFFRAIGGTLTDAAHDVINKKRRDAAVDRLNRVMRDEEKNAEDAYIALGKYYYTHLRSPYNNETEPLCRIAEQSEEHIRRVMAAIKRLCSEEDLSLRVRTVPESPRKPETSEAVREDETAERKPETRREEAEAEIAVETDDTQNTDEADETEAEAEIAAETDDTQNTDEADEVAKNFDRGIPW